MIFDQKYFTCLSTKFEFNNIEDKEIFLKLIKDYNSVVNYFYNRICEKEGKLSRIEAFNLGKTLKNIVLPSQFFIGAYKEAKATYKSFGKKVVFGGKKLFKERQKDKISKEEFQLKRLRPLYMLGTKKHDKCNNGNRYFQIISDNKVSFNVNRNTHIILNLKLDKNKQEEFKKLKNLQEEGKIALNYKISIENNISILYEIQKEDIYKPIKDRFLAIDLNPNYIGCTVVDWKDSYNFKIIKAELFSLKDLNNKYYEFKNKKLPNTSNEMKWLTNKRYQELFEINKRIVNLCIYFKCDFLVVEDLDLGKTTDLKKGKNLNRLVNTNWPTTKILHNLEKRAFEKNIKFLKVESSFSSFIGNLSFRNEKLPDPILASIEISRRGYEMNHQYILKDKLINKNIIFDNSEFNLNRIRKSLEELNCSVEFKDIKDLYYKIKNLNIRYRIPFNLENSEVFKLKSKNFYTKVYKLI